MDDFEIISLYFARDEQAISETDKKYGKLCFRVAKNLLVSDEDSYECVNDTYLTAWGLIPPTKPNNFTAFICKITRNLSLKKLEFLNAAKRTAKVTVSFEELNEIIDENYISQSLSEKELAEMISEFLWSEKEEYRNVFLRKYWFFDSVSEISKMYSFSENKVKTMLYRTRNRPREYLKRAGVEI